MKSLVSCVIAASLFVVAPACHAEPQASASEPAEAGSPQTGLAVAALDIKGSGHSHRFRVELARSDREQAMGLMFRKHVGPDEGMLFPFPSPRPASFWMKNTLIPLDMLFIRADGTIAMIAANTIPLSLNPVGVDEPVAAVLELAGGRAGELGIREGDHVSWPGGPRG